MSGVELIVGVVLGSVPIVLEAFDRYSAVYEACQTLHRPVKALGKLGTKLNVHKALFRSQIFDFLKVITNDEKRSQILLSGHWNHFPLTAELQHEEVRFLNERFQTWKDLLKLIHQTLLPVCDGFESIASGINQNQQVSRQIRARVELVLREKGLEKRMKELESLIANFRYLTENIIRSLRDAIAASKDTVTISTQLRAERANKIASYKLVQESSKKLFSLLVHKWTCSRHRKHWAFITLVNGSVSKDSLSGPRFEIDVKNDDISSESPQIWLEIQLDIKTPPEMLNSPAPDAIKETWDDLTMIQKHKEPIVSEKIQKIKNKLTKPFPKSVKFQATSPVLSKNPPTASTSAELTPVEVSNTAPTISTSPSENLELLKDMCCYMEQICSKDSRGCLGFIEDTGTHRFWRRSLESSQPQRMSLHEILIGESKGKASKILSRSNISKIGVSLAAAVLQYRSTPWLADTWDSSQVLFLKSVREGSGEESFNPSFSAELRHTAFTSRANDVTRDDHWAESSVVPVDLNAEALTKARSMTAFARNASLFCLGVVLLEIGYGKSWSLLQQEDLQEWPSVRPQVEQTDYLIAESLATRNALCRKMGWEYVKITRKCLGCDFGLGESDLENEELQDRFLDEVVFGLQRVGRSLPEEIA